MHFNLFFLAALVGTAVSEPLYRRTAAQIEADIATIRTQVTALDSSITAFPTTGGTLASALAIHSASTTLDTSLKKAVTDVQATPSITAADGTTILNAVAVIVPTIVHALNGIVAKKAAFQALPVGGIAALAKADISALNTDTTAFENGLITLAPTTDLKTQGTALKAQVDAAFANAVAAYADV